MAHLPHNSLRMLWCFRASLPAIKASPGARVVNRRVSLAHMESDDKDAVQNLLYLSHSTGRVGRTVDFVVNLDGRSATAGGSLWGGLL